MLSRLHTLFYDSKTSQSSGEMTVYLLAQTGKTFTKENLAECFDQAFFKRITEELTQNKQKVVCFESYDKAIHYLRGHPYGGLFELKIPEKIITSKPDAKGELQFDLSQLTQDRIINVTVLETPSYRCYTVTPNPAGPSLVQEQKIGAQKNL